MNNRSSMYVLYIDKRNEKLSHRNHSIILVLR